MKSGIYYKGKFIEFDPSQLDIKEKCYILYEPYELESPDQPDTLIAEKTNEFYHESGAIIHYHIQKPAPTKLRELLKSCKETVKLPKRVKGLQNIIKAIEEK